MHQNNDTHLAGGIEDDTKWQQSYLHLLIVPIRQYCLLSGAVRKHFIETLTAKLREMESTILEYRMITNIPNRYPRTKGTYHRLQRCAQMHYSPSKYARKE